MDRLFNRFTWGFEIEGLFRASFCSKLFNKYRDDYHLNFKTDSSVNLGSDDANWGYDYNDDEDEPTQEVTIGVFDRFENMLKLLSLFNNTNHVQNNSCGLHVHIRPKPKYRFLKERIGDCDFLFKLYKFAELNLCARIRDRIQNNNEYCRIRKGRPDMLFDWVEGEKYLFLRNHPQGTLEFRFFSPCKHKEDNVIRFFNYFFTELKKIKDEKKRTFFTSQKERKTIQAIHRIKKPEFKSPIFPRDYSSPKLPYTLDEVANRLEEEDDQDYML